MEKDWKKILSEEEFRVLREKGTERPFSGKFNNHFEQGIYTCKACNKELFDSSMKFDSGCGWPSFDNESKNANIEKIKDSSYGMIRTEIVCSNCKSHLGHLFNDGPTETSLRYCVNSVSINFKNDKE